jgi:cell pole-organizing protein PopZ
MVSNPQHEPTMEEILASIRKIISEDSNDAETSVGAASGATEDVDVLELTRDDVVEEPTEAAPHEPVRVTQMPGTVKHDDDVALETTEEPVSSSLSPAASNDTHSRPDSEEGFFSVAARKAMHDTFARLDAEYEEGPREATLETFAPEGSSVQAVFEHAVREKFGSIAGSYLHEHADEIVEQMKPIIREWMDEHFPAILEGAVRNEVERAVRASAAYKPPRR